MLDTDQIWGLLRSGAANDVHAALDAASPGQSADERFKIAHLRSAVLSRQGRFAESIEVLRQFRDDFPCRTVSHDQVARTLEHIGLSNEAINELRAAPFELEKDKYPLLVMDARFLLLYLQTKSCIRSSDPVIEEFPNDYISVVPNARHESGEFLTQADLKNLIDRNNVETISQVPKASELSP